MLKMGKVVYFMLRIVSLPHRKKSPSPHTHKKVLPQEGKILLGKTDAVGTQCQ